ncbi:MAG: hypothetical protein K8R53_08710 [Bacteroidales bacterium]|nr:hypothetical protein [Bacteroidales bacterium]
MKKRLLLPALILMTISVSLQATVWRVNNIPGVDADFSSFSDAQNAASVVPGDTLYIEPGAGTYGDITVTKKLVIIGNGYFLSENPETQANINKSQFGIIYLNNGCQGTIIEGCFFEIAKINTSDILLQKNYMLNSRPESGNHLTGIDLSADNISNIIIRKNYLINDYIGISDAVKTIRSSGNGVNNVLITNNFIKVSSTDNGARSIFLSSGFSGTVENNVIYGHIEIDNTIFNNNILITGNFTQNNCTYTHNIGNSTQFGITNGNQSDVNMDNVFVGAAGNSTDGQYQLKPGSPAIGAGTGGADCGMFGGQHPYKLSGLPAVPAIYFNEQTIDNVNQQIDVNLKTKSHNY